MGTQTTGKFLLIRRNTVQFARLYGNVDFKAPRRVAVMSARGVES